MSAAALKQASPARQPRAAEYTTTCNAPSRWTAAAPSRAHQLRLQLLFSCSTVVVFTVGFVWLLVLHHPLLQGSWAVPNFLTNGRSQHPEPPSRPCPSALNDDHLGTDGGSPSRHHHHRSAAEGPSLFAFERPPPRPNRGGLPRRHEKDDATAFSFLHLTSSAEQRTDGEG